MKNILVYGATGDQGHPLVDNLLTAGYRVRAVTRDPEQLKHSGLEAVSGDFSDRDSLMAASEGMDAIAMNLPFVYDVTYAETIAQNILEAATNQGLRKVVFNTSCVVADKDLGIGAHDGRRRIESAIAHSGLEYAVIRPTVFMDNIARSWIKPSIVNQGIFAYPAADSLKVSWICLKDVAKCMVSALSDSDISADKITVGGAEALTGHEIAEQLSAELGRTISFKSIPPRIFAADMSMRVTNSREIKPNSIYDGMARFYAWYNEQKESPVTVPASNTEQRLGIIPTSFRQWARSIDWTKPQ